MQRDSFVWYESFSKAINILPEANQLNTYRFIIDYGLWGKEPDWEKDRIAYAIFIMAKPQLDANYTRYINWKKWWKYWILWAQSKKNRINNSEKLKEPQSSPNQTPNVNGNANENVKENANDNVKSKLKKINRKINYSQDFESFWKIYPKKKWKQKAREARENTIKWWNDPKLLISKAWEYATEIKLKRVEDHYIKYAQWWLNDWRFDDDYFTGKKAPPEWDTIY